MRSSTRTIGAALVLACATQAGCDWVDRVRLSADERITRARPVPVTVTYAVTLARGLIKEDRKLLAEFDEAYARQLRVRSAECAKGYVPSIKDSTDAIREKLDSSCLERHDELMARWAGLWRAGLVAALPPLRPVPSPHVPSISLPQQINRVWFAERSGTALVQHSGNVSAVDLGNGRVLNTFQMRDRQGAGALSPNGRLFVWSDGEQLQLRLTENGDTVVVLGRGQAFTVQWLHSVGLLQSIDSQRLLVTDLRRHEQFPVAMASSELILVDAADGVDESVIVQHNRIARVKLAEPPDAPGLLTLAERRLPPISFARHASRTADGRLLIDMSSGRSLLLYDLSDLGRREIDMRPVVVEGISPTANADQVIVNGYIGRVDKRSSYLYTLSEGTLAELDAEARAARLVFYARPLGKLAAVTEAQILFLDDLHAGTPRRLEQLAADEIAAENQRKLEAFAKALDTVPPQDAAVVALKSQGGGPLDGVPPEQGSISRLARDAVIEAIGVYQGKRGADGGTSNGVVEVRVRPSRRPLVLVLSAYERVNWNLVREPGAQLTAVLTSGYHDQVVHNAGGVRVFAIGSSYAYEGAKIAPLEREVFRVTGKPISVFQGRYEGSTFAVGGP